MESMVEFEPSQDTRRSALCWDIPWTVTLLPSRTGPILEIRRAVLAELGSIVTDITFLLEAQLASNLQTSSIEHGRLEQIALAARISEFTMTCNCQYHHSYGKAKP